MKKQKYDTHADITSEVVKIAVFDFDGTCISGNAPVLLLWDLKNDNLISFWQFVRVLWWGFCYKLHLNVSYSWAINVIFESFEGWSRKKVDAYMKKFYDSRISCRIRKKAIKEIQKCKTEGFYTLLVSATFSMIPQLAANDLAVDHCISTKIIKLDDGTYGKTCYDGVVEGEKKVLKINDFCDVKFGKGKWRIVRAYGDHFTDAMLLTLALEPFVVNPMSKLEKIAKQNNWLILDWEGCELKGNGPKKI